MVGELSIPETAIEHLGEEVRTFEPPADFAARAVVGSMERYRELYERSVKDPEGFWGDAARRPPGTRPPGANPPGCAGAGAARGPATRNTRGRQDHRLAEPGQVAQLRDRRHRDTRRHLWRVCRDR